ncbi:YidB family protein [Citrifermentans bremense]|uniref:YidB family protein n=1 Tax=Citrifermentans bremense TaxID=60035 RepID=UPI00047B33E9|nr:YidB family protein [Citrifermentans bremense]
MGLLDELTSKAQSLFGSSEGKSPELLSGIMDMISNTQSGGLNGLVQTFKDNGLGDIVSSWVGTGENQPVNADQINNALGSETIQNLAEKAGVSSTEMSSMLAEQLPGLIDKLTPNGAIPEGGLLDQGLQFIKDKLA